MTKTLVDDEHLTESERFLLQHPATTPVDPAIHNAMLTELFEELVALRALVSSECSDDDDDDDEYISLGEFLHEFQGSDLGRAEEKFRSLLERLLILGVPDNTPAPIVTTTDEEGETRVAALWQAGGGLVGFTVAYDGLVAIHLMDSPKDGLEETALDILAHHLRALSQ